MTAQYLRWLARASTQSWQKRARLHRTWCTALCQTPSDTKDGTPIDEAQLEIFSVGSTYAAANDLADKVRAALDRKSQIVVGTVTVQSIHYTNEVVEVSEKRDLYISVQDYTTRITR